MLADIGGRDDNLGIGDIVVWVEDDLQLVADIRVVVHDVRDRGNQLNDHLSGVIARSRFPSDQNHPGDNLLALIIGAVLQPQISVDDIEDVHKLALVLVQALDLDVED